MASPHVASNLRVLTIPSWVQTRAHSETAWQRRLKGLKQLPKMPLQELQLPTFRVYHKSRGKEMARWLRFIEVCSSLVKRNRLVVEMSVSRTCLKCLTILAYSRHCRLWRQMVQRLATISSVRLRLLIPYKIAIRIRMCCLLTSCKLLRLRYPCEQPQISMVNPKRTTTKFTTQMESLNNVNHR